MRINLASLYDEMARDDALSTKKPCYGNRCTHSLLSGEQITKPQSKQNKFLGCMILQPQETTPN